MKPDNEISLKFKSRSQNEQFARAAVAAFATQLDPTIEELGDIKTIVSEAVTNAVVHAYPDRLGEIYIKAKSYADARLVIVVRDRGCGIPDIEHARQPTFTTGGDERSGMGFTIMESFSDALSVRSSPGRGTTVTISKYISSRRHGAC